MKKRIIHALLLSCNTATFLIERKSLSPLTSLQKFQLKWHLSICDTCKRFQEQSILLDKALEKLAGSSGPTEITNDALKNQIISALKK
jgi:orotate phosphoribosyltransferase-like protein